MSARKNRSKSATVLAAALWACGAGAAVAADGDNDGIDDAMDQCPRTAQMPKAPPGSKYAAVYIEPRRSGQAVSYPVEATGCEPDDDGDGVKNSADFCPGDTAVTTAAGVAENGCPRQSDGDGTPDHRDRCPGTPRGTQADRFGCPV